MLKEFILGNEAIGYIASELSKGRGLAQRLSSLPLQHGSVVTLLPDDVDEAVLLAFESGGVASGEENKKVADRIREYLKVSSTETALCVFEEGVATKGDPFLFRRQL